ncbi:MAG: hypothetical protein JOZ99_00655 [Actinobacteria bacterium]|nr:hypothetical protein [Actinomycetota bacterium]
MSTTTQRRTGNRKSGGDAVIDATHDSLRASIEAASRIARETLDAGTDAARKVQRSLREALDVLAAESGSGTRH